MLQTSQAPPHSPKQYYHIVDSHAFSKKNQEKNQKNQFFSPKSLHEDHSEKTHNTIKLSLLNTMESTAPLISMGTGRFDHEAGRGVFEKIRKRTGDRLGCSFLIEERLDQISHHNKQSCLHDKVIGYAGKAGQF